MRLPAWVVTLLNTMVGDIPAGRADERVYIYLRAGECVRARA